MAIKIKTDTAPDERKKSTAARKDVQSELNSREGELSSILGESRPDPAAGTQALPVDTPSRTFRTRAPNNTFDRRAYMAEYQRMYRKKMKEAKKTV